MRFLKHGKNLAPSGHPPASNMPDEQWKLPLTLAVGIHAVTLIMILVSPSIFRSRPVLPEIYTVNLFNAVESGPPASAPKAKSPAKPAPKPAAKPSTAAVPEPAPREIKTMQAEHLKKEVAPPAPAKPKPAEQPPVSERAVKTKSAAELAKLREIRSKLAAQHAREVEKAAEREVNSALASIRNLYKDETIARPEPANQPPAEAAEPENGQAAGEAESVSQGAAGSEGGVIEQEVLRRYLAQVHSRIQEHWSLPDLQSWPDDLEALMVIQIRKDGIVTDSFFEKRSANLYFNQFVEKAIREASPLPPFPPKLQEDQLEIGLRFRPGELL